MRRDTRIPWRRESSVLCWCHPYSPFPLIALGLGGQLIWGLLPHPTWPSANTGCIMSPGPLCLPLAWQRPGNWNAEQKQRVYGVLGPSPNFRSLVFRDASAELSGQGSVWRLRAVLMALSNLSVPAFLPGRGICFSFLISAICFSTCTCLCLPLALWPQCHTSWSRCRAEGREEGDRAELQAPADLACIQERGASQRGFLLLVLPPFLLLSLHSSLLFLPSQGTGAGWPNSVDLTLRSSFSHRAEPMEQGPPCPL